MFDYTICPYNSTTVFKETCQKIRCLFPDAEAEKLLIDVDGSLIQSYYQDGREIIVYDDYDVGAIYIKSELEIAEIEVIE